MSATIETIYNQKTIDESEVVIAPEMMLQVRSSMNNAINAQNRLVCWMTGKINSEDFSEEERQIYQDLTDESIKALQNLQTVLQHEDTLCPPNTQGKR